MHTLTQLNCTVIPGGLEILELGPVVGKVESLVVAVHKVYTKPKRELDKDR